MRAAGSFGCGNRGGGAGEDAEARGGAGEVVARGGGPRELIVFAMYVVYVHPPLNPPRPLSHVRPLSPVSQPGVGEGRLRGKTLRTSHWECVTCLHMARHPCMKSISATHAIDVYNHRTAQHMWCSAMHIACMNSIVRVHVCAYTCAHACNLKYTYVYTYTPVRQLVSACITSSRWIRPGPGPTLYYKLSIGIRGALIKIQYRR